MRFPMKCASMLALLFATTACVSTNATVLDLTPQKAGAVFGVGSQRKGRAVAIFVVADSVKAP